MGGQQGITGDLGAHLAVAQDEMREDREHRFTRRALDTPNSETTQADTRVMGVTRQAPAPITSGFVFELQAKSEEKGEDTFEKRFAVTQQLHIGRFVLKINRDGPVFTGLGGCGLHGHPQGRWSMPLVTKDEGNASQFQEAPRWRRGFTTKVGGMWNFWAEHRRASVSGANDRCVATQQIKVKRNQRLIVF